MDYVCGESPLAVVLKPNRLAADIGAGGRVDVAIRIDVAHLQAVGGEEFRVDVVNFPVGILIPNETGAVPAAGDDVQLAVPVHVGRQDVGGPGMFARKEMFLERLGGVFAGFPPGKPFTLAGFILRPALGGEGDIEAAVAIEIAGAEVMA